jgi:hypothetical protein
VGFGADDDQNQTLIRDLRSTGGSDEAAARAHAKKILAKQAHLGRSSEGEGAQGEDWSQYCLFSPGASGARVAAFSDDGVTVTVTDVTAGAAGTPTVVLNEKGNGQPLPNLAKSFHPLKTGPDAQNDYEFQAGRDYKIEVDYLNTKYTGRADLDGVLLIAYGVGAGGVPSGSQDSCPLFVARVNPLPSPNPSAVGEIVTAELSGYLTSSGEPYTCEVRNQRGTWKIVRLESSASSNPVAEAIGYVDAYADGQRFEKGEYYVQLQTNGGAFDGRSFEAKLPAGHWRVVVEATASWDASPPPGCDECECRGCAKVTKTVNIDFDVVEVTIVTGDVTIVQDPEEYTSPLEASVTPADLDVEWEIDYQGQPANCLLKWPNTSGVSQEVELNVGAPGFKDWEFDQAVRVSVRVRDCPTAEDSATVSTIKFKRFGDAGRGTSGTEYTAKNSLRVDVPLSHSDVGLESGSDLARAVHDPWFWHSDDIARSDQVILEEDAVTGGELKHADPKLSVCTLRYHSTRDRGDGTYSFTPTFKFRGKAEVLGWWVGWSISQLIPGEANGGFTASAGYAASVDGAEVPLGVSSVGASYESATPTYELSADLEGVGALTGAFSVVPSDMHHIIVPGQTPEPMPSATASRSGDHGSVQPIVEPIQVRHSAATAVGTYGDNDWTVAAEAEIQAFSASSPPHLPSGLLVISFKPSFK